MVELSLPYGQSIPVASANFVKAVPARNAGIDILRGLSVILVVIHHVGLRIPLKQGVLASFLPKWLISALIYNGFEAVFIFFVISGFLITSNTLARWGSLGAIHIRTFYERRASRIIPCLLALVMVLSVLDLAGISDYVITHSNQSLLRAIFSALGLHLNWYEGRTGYLPGSWDVLWSLSIEEVFYLAFPLVCLGLRRNRYLIPALALLALSLPISRAAWQGPDSGGNLKESFPRWVMSNVNHVSERKRKTLHEKNYSQSAKESRNPGSSSKIG